MAWVHTSVKLKPSKISHYTVAQQSLACAITGNTCTNKGILITALIELKLHGKWVIDNILIFFCWCSIYFMQGVVNIMETFDARTYAMDAVTSLALALNETLVPTSSNGTLTENIQVNLTALRGALQATMFAGASVST